MSVCCLNCFNDYAIKNLIEESGNIDGCNYCDSNDIKTMPLSEVGEFIRAGIERAYESLDQSRYFQMQRSLGESCFGDWPIDIMTDRDAFSQKLVNLNKQEDLINDLLRASMPHFEYIQHGERLEIINTGLVLKDKLFGRDENRFAINWSHFKNSVKHFSRYFDINYNREELLEPLAELLEKAKKTLNSGDYFWRIRGVDDSFQVDNIDDKEIGPPPNEMAKVNRMSPAGIPYLYCGSSIAVCKEEISLEDNSYLIIGKFKLEEDIDIIDLSEVTRIYNKSIFDPEYDHEMYWANKFMEHFCEEVSIPVSDDNESLEYVPTQLISEYIRKLGYKGIKFNSSQLDGHQNYVFFCGRDIHDLPFDYFSKALDSFKDWFEIVDIQVENI